MRHHSQIVIAAKPRPFRVSVAKPNGRRVSRPGKRHLVAGLLLAGLAAVAGTQSLVSRAPDNSATASASHRVRPFANVGDLPPGYASRLPGAASRITLADGEGQPWASVVCHVDEAALLAWARARRLSFEPRSVAQIPMHDQTADTVAYEVATFVREDRLLVHESRPHATMLKLVYDRQLQRLYAIFPVRSRE